MASEPEPLAPNGCRIAFKENLALESLAQKRTLLESRRDEIPLGDIDVIKTLDHDIDKIDLEIKLINSLSKNISSKGDVILEILDDGACLWRAISVSLFAFGFGRLSYIEVHRRVMKVLSDAGTDGIGGSGTEAKLRFLLAYALNKNPIKYTEIDELIHFGTSYAFGTPIALARLEGRGERVRKFNPDEAAAIFGLPLNSSAARLGEIKLVLTEANTSSTNGFIIRSHYTALVPCTRPSTGSILIFWLTIFILPYLLI